MSTSTSFGSVADLHESLNGETGNLVYLTGRTEIEMREQYNSIKGAKSIIGAYSLNSRHVLVLMVGGKVKKISRKKTTKNIGAK